MFKPNFSKHECIWRGVSFAVDFWITMGIRIPAEIQMETKGSQPYLSCQEERPIDVCGSAEANGRQGKMLFFTFTRTISNAHFFSSTKYMFTMVPIHQVLHNK